MEYMRSSRAVENLGWRARVHPTETACGTVVDLLILLKAEGNRNLVKALKPATRLKIVLELWHMRCDQNRHQL